MEMIAVPAFLGLVAGLIAHSRILEQLRRERGNLPCQSVLAAVGLVVGALTQNGGLALSAVALL